MEKGLLGPLERIDSSANQVFPTWGEDLEPDIVRCCTWSLDKSACEIEVGLGCRWERNLNLLVAELHKHLEVLPFLFAILRTISRRLHGQLEYARTIGSTKLWLPSRKSVASHRGGFSIILFGHVRFSSFKGGNLLYFLDGSASLPV